MTSREARARPGASATRDERPVFLVGFMASGKSATARALAAELGWDCVDTDLEVERAAGCSVARVFATEGESGFRRREWEVLLALGGRSRFVAATGGGLFARHECRRWIAREGRSVWLDVAPERLRARVPRPGERPLWDDGDPVGWRALYERRRAAYALADLRVEASAGSPRALARRIGRQLGLLSGKTD